MLLWAVILLSPVFFYLWSDIDRRRRSRLPYPPGPKGYPIIGNLLDMPKIEDEPWKVYNEWHKTYGDMIYVTVLGQPTLLLNSLSRTNDLFIKRSSIMSDRPSFRMIVELMGWTFNIGFLNYSERWRKFRRAFRDFFYPAVMYKYHEQQQKEAKILLHRLLVTPEDFFEHIKTTFAAMVMRSVYGIEVHDEKNPYVLTATESVKRMSKALLPGSFLVDHIAWLKYVPAWVPGAGFQRYAAATREISWSMVNKPFNKAKDDLAQGVAMPSIAASLISKMDSQGLTPEEYAEEDLVARSISAVAYAAGSDTTVATVQSFFMAMTVYPDVQKKAQDELLRVMGPNKLPTFGDRDQLPYLNAIIKESLRWQPVSPLGVPHAAAEDCEYDGYFIPKGTIIMGNTWGILHDPEVYPDPERFNPDRFLKDGQLNPDIPDSDTAAFGFGRRMCPGRFFSDGSLFSILSAVLTVYDIRAPLGPNGKRIKVEPRVTSAALSYPVPFPCEIVPRSPEARTLIEQMYLNET